MKPRVIVGSWLRRGQRAGKPRRLVFSIGLVLALWLPSCGIGDSTDAPARTPSSPEPERPAATLIEIPNARTPLDGMLTGGQPTPEQLERAAAAGYRTIINLRTDAEEGFDWEEAAVAELGMRYVMIPVAGAAGLTRENVERLGGALSDPEAAPVMIHCKSGNRVGALLALKAAWIDGASGDEAIQLGLDAGLTRLESKTRALLEDRP